MTIKRRCRRYRMALAIGVLVAAASLTTPHAAQAQSRRIPPWCAFMGGDFGYDCSFYTFEQCMETARGLGNYCVRNPYLAGADRPDRQRRRVRN
jgi:hypothetical protein